MNNVNILSLPNELLLCIFELVKDLDRISLSNTCLRFNLVVCDKRFLREMDLNAEYKLTIMNFKVFFSSNIHCLNIKVLDITSCYWIVPSEIIKCVVKMKNLKSLYAADTQLTFRHLGKILPSLKELERLSISGERQSLIADYITETDCGQLQFLKCLIICLNIDNNGKAIKELSNWLDYCFSLEELWLITRPEVDKLCEVYHRRHFRKLLMPKLHTLVVDIPIAFLNTWDSFTNSILCLKPPTFQWKTLWLPQKILIDHLLDSLYECEILSIANMKPNKYENLHHLRMDSSLCPPFSGHLPIPTLTSLSFHGSIHEFECLVQYTSLQCLSLLNTTVTDSLFTTMLLLKNLKSLSFVNCKFNIPMNKRKDTIEAFKMLIKTIPGLKELQLCGKLDPEPCDWKFWDSLVPCLVNWTKLTKLCLSGLCVHDEKFLIELSLACCDLETLTLMNMGLPGHCKFLTRLYKALPNWKKLKHFKFEQKNIGSFKGLIETFQKCPTIEKISIIEDTTFTDLNVDFKDVIDMLHSTPNLVFLYIRKRFLANSWRKKMLQLVKDTFKHSRPALFVCIENEPDDIHMPWAHMGMVDHTRSFPLKGALGTWRYPEVRFN